VACYPDLKVGIALTSLEQLPLNALRHRPEAGTVGWYIWGGELSDAPDFFQPLHASHLDEYVPNLLPYLALAPGWRVLLAPDQVEVWHDPGLLAE
jgi:hypothetical protein